MLTLKLCQELCEKKAAAETPPPIYWTGTGFPGAALEDGLAGHLDRHGGYGLSVALRSGLGDKLYLVFTRRNAGRNIRLNDIRADPVVYPDADFCLGIVYKENALLYVLDVKRNVLSLDAQHPA